MLWTDALIYFTQSYTRIFTGGLSLCSSASHQFLRSPVNHNSAAAAPTSGVPACIAWPLLYMLHRRLSHTAGPGSLTRTHTCTENTQIDTGFRVRLFFSSILIHTIMKTHSHTHTHNHCLLNWISLISCQMLISIQLNIGLVLRGWLQRGY